MRNGRVWLLIAALGALGLVACGRESADWKSATAADTAEAYQQFLQQHPGSANATQAQTRIKQLAEDHDWQTAAAADSRDAYEQFVAQHADSKWAQEARIRIENFAQSSASAASATASSTPAVSAPGDAGATAARSVAPAVIANTPSPKLAMTAKKAAAKPAAANKSTLASTAGGSHYVQLGAFRSKESAESQWKKLSAKYPGQLQSLTPRYVAGKSNGSRVYRLQVGVSSASTARGLCSTLKKHSQACVAVTA